MTIRPRSSIRRRAGPRPPAAVLLPLVLATLAGCVDYEPAPLEPREILRELEEVALPPRAAPAEGKEEQAARTAEAGLSARAAAAFAVTHNPRLAARRAELGIAEAELVRAGLLADPVAGWDAMDALAVKLTGGVPETTEYLSGLGLSWELPRPGEIGARVGAAQARREEVRQELLAAEWRLVRRVHGAFLGVAAARARLELNEQVEEIARRTAEVFRQAREVGGATAIQENLAAVELASLERERVRLEGEHAVAREELNGLLGLPPEADVALDLPADPFACDAEHADAAAILERALDRRPDLQALLAAYQAAEEELRMEVARQWPALEIGTGIALTLPLFSGFNRAAIDAARARRERAGLSLRAAIHALRAESHAAVTALDNAAREVRAFEEKLLPRVQESLRLGNEAFAARELTLVEILTAQRQVLEARSGHLEARVQKARARMLLDTVTGDVLAGAQAASEEEKK